MCKQFLEKANGVDIFPKLPSLIKPGIKRWEINQSIELLGLQTEEGFKSLMAELKTAISIGAPAQAAGRLHINNANSIDNSLVSVVQPRVHVGPIPTIGQITAVANPTEVAVKCKWWPVCTSLASVCGGRQKRHCKFYGTNGTKTPPSEEEFARLLRFKTWSAAALKRDCAYYPLCTQKAWDCGGTKRKNCIVYHGANSTKQPPTEEQLREAKRDSKRRKQMDRRAGINVF